MTRRVMAVTVGIYIACGVQAEDKTFDFPDGNFSDDGNWEPFGAPESDDRIIIPAGKICHVDINATVETFEVRGELIIDAEKTLTLVNHVCRLVPTCTVLDSVIAGFATVELKDSSTLAIEDNNHTLSGDGQILSQDGNSPEITIASGLVLRNELDLWDPGNHLWGGIRGALSILGPGTILNDGNIEALPFLGL